MRAALRPTLEEISDLARSGGEDSAHFRLPRAAELLLLRKQREKAQLKQKADVQQRAAQEAEPHAAPEPETSRRDHSPRHSTEGSQLAKELSAADFRSMLERKPQAAEKLSTRDIRRRLGYDSRASTASYSCVGGDSMQIRRRRLRCAS